MLTSCRARATSSFAKAPSPAMVSFPRPSPRVGYRSSVAMYHWSLAPLAACPSIMPSSTTQATTPTEHLNIHKHLDITSNSMAGIMDGDQAMAPRILRWRSHTTHSSTKAITTLLINSGRTARAAASARSCLLCHPRRHCHIILLRNILSHPTSRHLKSRPQCHRTAIKIG